MISDEAPLRDALSTRRTPEIEGDAARDVRARDTNQRRTLRSDAEDDAGDARGLSVTGCHVCRPHHAVRDPGRLGRRRAGGPGRRRHGRREASISAAHGAGSIPRAVSGAGGSAVPSAAATPGATAAAPRVASATAAPPPPPPRATTRAWWRVSRPWGASAQLPARRVQRTSRSQRRVQRQLAAAAAAAAAAGLRRSSATASALANRPRRRGPSDRRRRPSRRTSS